MFQKSDAKIQITITASYILPELNIFLAALIIIFPMQTLQISTKSTAQFLSNSCFKNGTQKQKFPISKIPIQNDRVYAPLGSQKRQLSPSFCVLVHFLKICHGVGRRVAILGTTELMFIEPGVKINGAYYHDVLLGRAPSAGDSFRSRRLLHLQCSSSPSWWHRGGFVSQYTRFHLTFAVAAQ